VTETLAGDSALHRGEALNDAGRHAEAAGVLRPAIDVDPGNEWLQVAYAWALLQTGHARKALAHALVAYEIRPTSPHIARTLAECQLELKQLDDAAVSANRAIELKPESGFGYDVRGRITLRAKHLRAAEMDFRQAIRLEPNVWAFHNNLGLALRLQKRDKEAVDEFELAVKQNPKSRVARRNLFGAASAYQTAGVLLGFVFAIRLLTGAATRYVPEAVADLIFLASIFLATIAAIWWSWYRRRHLSAFVRRAYAREWFRERAMQVLRYLFRAVPVFAVVIAVIWLGLTQSFGFLPGIIAGGLFIAVWWFAWQPAWRRLIAILDPDRT